MIRNDGSLAPTSHLSSYDAQNKSIIEQLERDGFSKPPPQGVALPGNLEFLLPDENEKNLLVANLSYYQYFLFRFLRTSNIKMLSFTYPQIFPQRSTVYTCLQWTAYGRRWEPQKNTSGRPPFLCKADELEIAQLISDAINENRPYRSCEIIELFEKYHEEREQKANLVYLLTKHRKPVNESSNPDSIKPCLRFLYRFLNTYRNRFKLYKMDRIEALRIVSASKSNLKPWYKMVYSELTNIKNICIMGADEINLEGDGKNPYYITDRTHRIIMKNNPHFNHTSIMFAHFMEGDSLPPFIIFKGLSNEPKELRDLMENGKAFVASNSSGWMTEDMFVLWSLFVASHVSNYR